ncbi:hypothetical protein Mapa_007544 [Marchantia paleacea]|nr:hypothetical protein Mapa_007544 [Marchantia paleacea]
MDRKYQLGKLNRTSDTHFMLLSFQRVRVPRFVGMLCLRAHAKFKSLDFWKSFEIQDQEFLNPATKSNHVQ